jgi:high affinity sulfate transporter 1
MASLTPGLVRFRHYDRAWLRPDLVAGVTVAAYLVPQCMAYGELAGLQPVAGLWAILAPLAIYALFGSSRQLSVGPESTTAVMAATAVAPLAAGDPGRYAALAATLAIVTGLWCLIGRLGRLGFLANLLSKPVLVGYMAGVAITMMTGQLTKVTGVPTDGDTPAAEVHSFLTGLSAFESGTFVLAAAVVAFLFAMQVWFPKLPGPLLAVLASTAVVAMFDLDASGISVVGEVPQGLPVPGLPDVTWSEVASLLAPAVGIAVVGYSDNVLTARSFANRGGYRIDANQELLSLGLSNIGAGVLRGFPVSSSGSRTSIGDSLGSRSQLYSLVAMGCVVLVLLFLGPLLALFPSAALGAIVIYAAIRLIDLPEMRRMLHYRRSEFALALVAVAGVLVPTSSSASWWPSACRCWTCLTGSCGPTTPCSATSPACPATTTSRIGPTPSRCPGCASTATTPPSCSPTPRTSGPGPSTPSSRTRPRSSGSCSTSRRGSTSTSPPSTS